MPASAEGGSGRDKFYHEYRGATVAGILMGLLGFFAVVSSNQYGDTITRLANATGALIFFGSAAYFIGWLVTRIVRRVTHNGNTTTVPPKQPAGTQRASGDAHGGRTQNVSTPEPQDKDRIYSLQLDHLDRTIRDAALPHWPHGNYVAAVESAARAAYGTLQDRVGYQGSGEADLVNKAFSEKAPTTYEARLRFPGDRSSKTWNSKMNGARGLGSACFAGVRNIAAHHYGLNWSREESFEYLVLFSIFLRWVRDCEVERHR